jgi:hypothetical protein
MQGIQNRLILETILTDLSQTAVSSTYTEYVSKTLPTNISAAGFYSNSVYQSIG